jgi:hypothetical protein
MDFELTRRIATLESWLRNGFTVAALTVRGALSAGSLTVGGATATGTLSITLGAITSGTYTPTLTNTTNIDASTAEAAQYMRVGNVVTVSGRVAIDATAAAATVMGVSLPIASNFANLRECGGIVGAAGGPFGEIRADSTNDRATFAYTATGTANTAYYFTFTYRII